MKNFILSTLTLCILITFSNQSNAQLEARAGLVLAKIKTSALGINLNSDAQIGAQLGLTYGIAINDNFSFRPGLMYTMKGAKYNDDTTDESESATLGYVGVPLDFVYSTPISGNTLSIHAGPYLDYLLHATDGTKDGLSSTDLGLNFGAGFNFGKFGVGFNISTGLSNIAKEDIDAGLGGIIDFGSITQKNNFNSLFLTYSL